MSHVSDSLAAWIEKSYQQEALINEDDVETKFLIPLFQLLQYPEGCRRGKFPIPIYNKGKSGRRPEVDQAYFATIEPEKQDGDTCLMVVECKAPNVNSLGDALQQAQFYGEYLKNICYIVTNGDRIQAVIRRRFHEDEMLFDCSIADLADREAAKEFFAALNFETVKRIKEANIDPLIHQSYIDFHNAIQNHPDIVAILRQGDFGHEVVEDEQGIFVMEPTVVIKCDLPSGLRFGSCEIQFSSVLLQGTHIELSHRELLSSFFAGLNTPLDWGIRRFIRPVAEDVFELQIGDMSVSLNRRDAEGLCKCVDVVASRYKERLLAIENILKAWDFEFGYYAHAGGYCIGMTRVWLWKLIKRYCKEVGVFRANSDHEELELYASNTSVEINPISHFNHTVLVPKSLLATGFDNLPTGYVEILYQPHKLVMHSLAKRSEGEIGIHGVWNVDYTEQWFNNNFVPTVLNHYSPLVEQYMQQDIAEVHSYPSEVILRRHPLWQQYEDAESMQDLIPYLEFIQRWLHACNWQKLPTELVQPFCRAMASALVQSRWRTAHGHDRLDYAIKNLDDLVINEYGVESFVGKATGVGGQVKVIRYLVQENASLLKTKKTVKSEYVDYFFRAFGALLKDVKILASQVHINMCKQELRPLFELSWFENRYVDSAWPEWD